MITEPDLQGTADYLAPAKCLPGGGCDPVADTPTMSWNAVPGALNYRVYVAVDPNFTNIYRTYDTIVHGAHAPRESYLDNQAAQAYYWFVRPIRSIEHRTLRQRRAAQRLGVPEAIGGHPSDQRRPRTLEVADEVTFTWQDFLAMNQGLPGRSPRRPGSTASRSRLVADYASTIETRLVDTPFYTAFDKIYREGPHLLARPGDRRFDQPADLEHVGDTSRRSRLLSADAYPADGADRSGVPYLQWSPQDVRSDVRGPAGQR